MSKTTKVRRVRSREPRLFVSECFRGVMAAIAVLSIVCVCMLTSCNVTRTVTTKSEYFTHGDSTCTIVTKTIESYDASKKGM